MKNDAMAWARVLELVNGCEACACFELDIPEPAYAVGLSLCGDCEAYYGVAELEEGR